MEESEAAVLTLERRTDLASGQFALSDNGDEVVLLDAEALLADQRSERLWVITKEAGVGNRMVGRPKRPRCKKGAFAVE